MSRLVELLNKCKEDVIQYDLKVVIKLLELNDENHTKLLAKIEHTDSSEYNPILIKLIEKKLELYNAVDSLVDEKTQELVLNNDLLCQASKNKISAYRNAALTLIAASFIVSSTVAITGILGAPLLAIGIITAATALFAIIAQLVSSIMQQLVHAKHDKIFNDDIETGNNALNELELSPEFIAAKETHQVEYNAAAKVILEQPDLRLDDSSVDSIIKDLDEVTRKAQNKLLKNMRNDEGMTTSSSNSGSPVSAYKFFSDIIRAGYDSETLPSVEEALKF